MVANVTATRRPAHGPPRGPGAPAWPAKRSSVARRRGWGWWPRAARRGLGSRERGESGGRWTLHGARLARHAVTFRCLNVRANRKHGETRGEHVGRAASINVDGDVVGRGRQSAILSFPPSRSFRL
jgi:hypothetical protein